MMRWVSIVATLIVLVVALLMATIGSLIQINNRVIQNKNVREMLGFSTATAPAEPDGDNPASANETRKGPNEKAPALPGGSP